MSNYDDILNNEDYDQGFKDGREDYKNEILSKFSGFIDRILEEELNRTFPRITYEFSLLQRENILQYRELDELREELEEVQEQRENLYQIINEKEEDAKTMRDLLLNAKDLLLRYKNKFGDIEND